MDNILITGASGQVGRELTEFLNRCGFRAIGFTKSELDITCVDSLNKAIKTHKPEIIINSAAFTNVDGAETDVEAAYKVNRDGAKNVSSLCCERRIPLIHFSTDYVFDGYKKTAYLESDMPNPISEYAKSKYQGELAVKSILREHIILRVSWVFGKYGKNFVKSVLTWAKTKEKLNIVNDQMGSPTYATHLCEAIAFLLKKYFREKTLKWGLYHYCGSPSVTRYDFARIIIEEALRLKFIEKAPQLVPVPSTSFQTPAKRPQNSSLNCDLIWNVFGVYQKEWRLGIKDIIESMDEST